MYAENKVVTEEKIYSTATLENEFADNRVMVVISNEASLQFNQYSVSDFSDINCKHISNLSTATEAKVKEASISKASRSQTTGSIDAKINTYNQVLCLELKDTGKDKVLDAIKTLQKRDDVIYAGPDYLIQACATMPDDDDFDEQWAAEKIELPAAWDITTGSSAVLVGVLDSGIIETHPDLIDNINFELSKDMQSDNSTADPLGDPTGHGTTVAGVIGAKGDNGEGVSGVCWNVSLVSLRVFDMDGEGYSSSVVRAINYAEKHNIQILNFSGGWFVEDDNFNELYDVALMSAIENYSGLFVCAAGNYGANTDTKPFYPSFYNLYNLISVGASTRDDQKCSFSNYGHVTVDLFAPGKDIYTTAWRTGYGETEGTSIAAPFVTGVAALLLSAYPDLTPCEIKDTIMTNVDKPEASFNRLCVSGGRLNAYKALKNVRRHANMDGHPTNDGHVRICTAHMMSKTIPHSYLYTDNGSAGHIATCSECGFSVPNQHNMLYHNISVNSGHTGMCKFCDYTCSESHTWVTAGLKIRCSKCGVITTHAPVTPFMLPPQLLAQIEQMGYVGDFAMDIGDGTVLCRIGDQYYLVKGQTEDTALQYLQHELSVLISEVQTQ